MYKLLKNNPERGGGVGNGRKTKGRGTRVHVYVIVMTDVYQYTAH